jgi:NAD(P)-dependent dehydrogenase (short-subunit alcohol dehydrogenase family)
MPAILITGANRGLGLEFTRQYAADGWTVIAACRDPQAAKDLQALAASSGGRIRVIAMNVADTASVKAAASALAGEPIDILLNNAGVGSPAGKTLGSLDYAAWLEVLDVNTLGPARVVEALVENVAKGERKLILTITSRMGSIDDNTSGGSYPYRSSKAAVNMVVKSLSLDLAPRGIACVLLHPGWVRTDMGGASGKLTPAESIGAMRKLIAKLGSEDSGKFYDYDGTEIPW